MDQKPSIKRFLRAETKPGFLDYTTIALAQYAYGVPDQNEIEQGTSLDQTKAAIVDAYATPIYYDQLYTYNDITDENQPKWRFHLRATGVNADTLTGGDLSELINYRVEIDAHTGELLTIEPYRQGGLYGV